MTSDATPWRWGPLELELPPGWSASDDGERIEIVPPDAAGAAHVERTWLVRMLAHRSGAVLCTFDQPAPGNPERTAEARTLLESVSPAEARA